MKNDILLNQNKNQESIKTPTFSCFTLCDDCFLKCEMCHKWKDDIYIKSSRGKMGLDDWKRCASSLREFAPDNFVINFGGGEVTTVPWLFDIVHYCYNLGFKTNIATNGFLIDERMARKMSEAGLDYINISLDSLNPQIHDQLRGKKGVYQKAMEAISLVFDYSKNTAISICSIIMEQTLSGIVDLVKWVQDNKKISMIYLMALMQPNNTHPDIRWNREKFAHLWPSNSQKIQEVLDELIDLKLKGFKICNTVEHLQAFKAYFKNPREFVKKGTCHIDQAIHISSIGDVFMCYQHKELGSARQNDLKELWTSELSENIRAQIKRCQENCHFLLNCKFEE
ncbi:MAG: radical SAM protein [Candidatus Omnitrophota bacterium]